MSGPQTTYQLAQDALEEHEQIHFFLDQVSQSLQRLREGISDVEPMRRLAAQIEALMERLKEHHQMEERDGLFRAILDALPEARVEISRLVRQHERIIEILEMARIHAQCGEPGEADALRIDLERFMAMFRQHEQDEEQLMRAAISRENKTLLD
jgi:hypothetical protein